MAKVGTSTFHFFFVEDIQFLTIGLNQHGVQILFPIASCDASASSICRFEYERLASRWLADTNASGLDQRQCEVGQLFSLVCSTVESLFPFTVRPIARLDWRKRQDICV